MQITARVTETTVSLALFEMKKSEKRKIAAEIAAIIKATVALCTVKRAISGRKTAAVKAIGCFILNALLLICIDKSYCNDCGNGTYADHRDNDVCNYLTGAHSGSGGGAARGRA